MAAYLGDLFSVGHEGDSRHVHDGGYGTTLTSFTRKENIFGCMEFILSYLQNILSFFHIEKDFGEYDIFTSRV